MQLFFLIGSNHIDEVEVKLRIETSIDKITMESYSSLGDWLLDVFLRLWNFQNCNHVGFEEFGLAKQLNQMPI